MQFLGQVMEFFISVVGPTAQPLTAVLGLTTPTMTSPASSPHLLMTPQARSSASDAVGVTSINAFDEREDNADDIDIEL